MMAVSPLFTSLAVILLISMSEAVVNTVPAANGSSSPPQPQILPPVDVKACPGLCVVRCQLHSRPNHCNRVCNTCCYRCRCVPPGTFGNKEMCGKCYTDMTTHGGRPKCP